MQLQQPLTVGPPDVGILALRNSADPSLRATEMGRDLHLRASVGSQVSDDVFPVHACDYQETTKLSQQQTDRYFYHNPDMSSEHDMNTMSGRLKYAREVLHGISQPELARRAGISQSFIGALESVNQQNSKYLPEIAYALGVSAYWLKTGKGKAPSKLDAYKAEEPVQQTIQEPLPANAKEQRVLALLRKLPEAELDAMLIMLETRFAAEKPARKPRVVRGEADTEDLQALRDRKLGKFQESTKVAK